MRTVEGNDSVYFKFLKNNWFTVVCMYPRADAIRNVIAGTRLPVALAIDDEAKYIPSK